MSAFLANLDRQIARLFALLEKTTLERRRQR
jgi:hypothetical protein